MALYVLLPGDGATLRLPAGTAAASFALGVVVEMAVEPPVQPPPPGGPPWEDVTASFPTNPTAQNPPASPGRWATRRPSGVTVHHTGMRDAYALARVCLGKAYDIGGRRYVGLPTTQYHIFVDTTGDALLCVPLAQAGWHDHAGYPSSNVSVGIAGYWHKQRPPLDLIEGLARVCAYLMKEFDIPVGRVAGHRERALRNGVSTECPGWYDAPVGAGWKPDFDAALTVMRGVW